MSKKKTRMPMLALSLAGTIGFSLISACTRMSESVSGPQAGLNGSFEQDSGQMPLNWLLYTAQTCDSGEFHIGLDPTQAREGKQSLKFDVQSCSAKGGRFSPGLATEIPAKPGAGYLISFWIKNEGASFRAEVNGVSAFKKSESVYVQSDDTSDWKQYQCRYTMPEHMSKLRFELNVLQPGTLWIDDIQVQAIQ